jgi:ribosomal protein L37E
MPQNEKRLPMQCWRCGSGSGLNEMGHCVMCGRSPAREIEEAIEKKKSKVRGNPKSYGSNWFYRYQIHLKETILEELWR